LSFRSLVHQTDEIAVTSTLPQTGAREPAGTEFRNRGAIIAWAARLGIVGVACGLAWYTWGHWGDFQVDCGRELYVPAAILKGKLLFRDLWYMYGPLAPYLKALLFRIFGIHLTVLYLLGLTLTVGSALLTFEIGRQFNLGVAASLAPPLFFLVEAFYPFIFNFVFPYSYAASLGASFGLACLYFTLRYLSEARTLHLAIAAILAGLAVLTKQEFGLACIALLGFGIAASFLIRRSLRDFLRDSAVFLASLSPALAVYGWFAWKLSPKVVFFENWIATPGTYFMRVWGKDAMAHHGFRFSPAEVIETAAFSLLAIALWSTLASLNAAIIKKLGLRSPFSVALLTAANLIPIGIVLNSDSLSILLLRLTHAVYVTSIFALPKEIVTQTILPKGLFLFGVFFLVHSSWRFWKGRKAASDGLEAALGLYAVLIGFRVMWETGPSPYKYALFFNVPLFLIFVISVDRIVCWAARSLEPKQRNLLAGSMLTAEVAVLFVMLFPNPRSLPAPLTTDYGTFYTKHDVAVLFPQIITFMKTHTRNGRDILVLPEPPSLYVFAGMQAPSRWYSLLPGVLPPDREPEFLQEIAANQVRYVLIANRAMPEFGPIYFGHGYNDGVYRWITENYVRVGQFGPLPNEPSTPYIMWVYEKKDTDKALEASQIYRSKSLPEAAEAGAAYDSR